MIEGFVLDAQQNCATRCSRLQPGGTAKEALVNLVGASSLARSVVAVSR
jgi:hypothetical protein